MAIVFLVRRYFYNKKWNMIESLNEKVGINRENSRIDERGYLRWKTNDKLCHREIAWNVGIRGSDNFGASDIHHKDKNKFNCNPDNLECLTRTEHRETHGLIVHENGIKYIRLCRINKVYRETKKAFLIAHRWVPKSQTLIRDGYIYVTEWLTRQKGFDLTRWDDVYRGTSWEYTRNKQERLWAT